MLGLMGLQVLPGAGALSSKTEGGLLILGCQKSSAAFSLTAQLQLGERFLAGQALWVKECWVGDHLHEI
jgi:hypothetical protein